MSRIYEGVARTKEGRLFSVRVTAATDQLGLDAMRVSAGRREGYLLHGWYLGFISREKGPDGKWKMQRVLDRRRVVFNG